MESKLIKALVGITPSGVTKVIADYGENHFSKVFADYQRNMVFAGVLNTKKKQKLLNDPKAIELLGNNPKGYGFRIQKDEATSLKANYCLAVIGKEVGTVKKALQGVDINDPDNDDFVMGISRIVGKLNSYKEIIKNENTVVGNDLKTELAKHKTPVRIKGVNGQIQIFVSRFTINEENPGELILTADNACDDDFEITGKIRGLQGLTNGINESHYCFFHVEDNHLFVWESWFKNGKEFFNELEHGTLIK